MIEKVISIIASIIVVVCLSVMLYLFITNWNGFNKWINKKDAKGEKKK